MQWYILGNWIVHFAEAIILTFYRPLKKCDVGNAAMNGIDHHLRKDESINIKQLDYYKEGFLEFLNVLPISKMEEDIKNSSDQFINELYKKLQEIIEQTKYYRYKENYHKLGICAIYSLIDPIYGDPVRWLFHVIRKSKVDIKAKSPEKWRCNNIHKVIGGKK